MEKLRRICISLLRDGLEIDFMTGSEEDDAARNPRLPTSRKEESKKDHVFQKEKARDIFARQTSGTQPSVAAIVEGSDRRSLRAGVSRLDRKEKARDIFHGTGQFSGEGEVHKGSRFPEKRKRGILFSRDNQRHTQALFCFWCDGGGFRPARTSSRCIIIAFRRKEEK